jgi:hypothetical protein
MTPRRVRVILWLLVVGLTLQPRLGATQDAAPCPTPLSLTDVVRLAGERRDEVRAQHARVRAGEARPIIASGLEGSDGLAVDRSPALHAGGRRRDLVVWRRSQEPCSSALSVSPRSRSVSGRVSIWRRAWNERAP